MKNKIVSDSFTLKDDSLPDDVLAILRQGATEPSFTCEMSAASYLGTYLCRGCGLALFRQHMQFNAGCGWPSFDDVIAGAVLERADKDGYRTEILCGRCHAHLGHVFDGEGFTEKNRRHCVNSKIIERIENKDILDTKEAIFAGGCFWGIQYYFNKLPGVLKTEVGYIGGNSLFPNYQEVCTKKTGHFEALRVLYNPATLNFNELVKYFFEIHDPTQRDGQGPDHGEQYLSAIFYFDDTQKQTAEQLIQLLKNKNYDVATQLLPVKTFWPAETMHQYYYEKTKGVPYCHKLTKRF